MAYTRYSVNRLLHHDGVTLESAYCPVHPEQRWPACAPDLYARSRLHRRGAPLSQGDSARGAAAQFLPRLERINISMGAAADRYCQHRHAGHKNIVWISPGCRSFPGGNDWDSEKQLFDAIRRLSDQLLKARISIYSIDPRGIQARFSPVSFARTTSRMPRISTASIRPTTRPSATWPSRRWPRKRAAMPSMDATMSTARLPPASVTATLTTRWHIHPPTKISGVNLQAQDHGNQSAGLEGADARRLLRHPGRRDRQSETATSESWLARSSRPFRITASLSRSAIQN